jgi:hypothetical protein
MNSTAPNNWHEANQRALMAALATVRASLERHVERKQGNEPLEKHPEPSPSTQQEKPDAKSTNSALDSLCAAFGLSSFEREVLLLCAGSELDSTFAARCAAGQGDARRLYPTFSLALAALPEAHWSAMVPAAPLRRWRLIEVGAGDSLTTSPLRIDERILHYLTGISYLDDRLQGLIEPLVGGAKLPPSHEITVGRMVETWSRLTEISGCPVIQLCGEDDPAKRSIAEVAYSRMGLQLHVLKATDIPSATAEREALVRLWEREAILSSGALLIDCAELDTAENIRLVHAFLERLHGMTVVTGREPIRAGRRPMIHLEVGKPSAMEQQAIWGDLLGPQAGTLNGQLDSVVTHFNLGAREIHAAHAELGAYPSESSDGEAASALWDACRVQSRQRLDGLAQRIEPAATWDDLVLPEAQRQILREMASHARQRATVYERWGFSAKGLRGLGISALFAGASGTGKTMAAEVLAGELRLDLYRIDLSSVVSKYIGETEKNLRRVFDAAEQGGAILLFDEADALFGKRSEVKDSHDRYANIEVSYLLQRMEAYRGLAILTTNMKNALDTAFLRRIRFVVQFPFPDAAQRAEIWRRIFPSSTPTDGIEVAKLSRLNVAGGNIRNVAINAAFLAAEAREPVRMNHLLRAARTEYAKLEKPLTDAEIGNW